MLSEGTLEKGGRESGELTTISAEEKKGEKEKVKKEGVLKSVKGGDAKNRSRKLAEKKGKGGNA